MKPKSAFYLTPFSSWSTRAAWISVFCGMLGGDLARAFTAADADTIFDAHTKAFYRVEDGRGWHRKNTEGARKADYWTRAEMLEMVLDVHARTRNLKHLEMFAELFRGFIADHGRTWERNDFNDDLMWMVIACTRAHLASGNTEYLSVAKENFDLCYKRAISTDLGGGLWWKTDNKSKNACVNGPGSIAAFLLGLATKDASYTAKAKELFLWERDTLFDKKTGKVFDSIGKDGKLASFALTYNQGTFVGAANLLGYNSDARLAATYTMTKMGKDGYLPASGENGDGGGFNGIGVRWIARYMKDQREQATFEPWLQKNAEAAWQARRVEDNLSWCAWPKPTPPGVRFSWGCSNAVVIMQTVRPTEPSKRED
ncbi:MAG: glycoside hydrolase family 76 protein [Verrucomicrobiota bacterium]